MYADVLLLGLHHPHSLLPHLVHDPENIHHVVFSDPLSKYYYYYWNRNEWYTSNSTEFFSLCHKVESQTHVKQSKKYGLYKCQLHNKYNHMTYEVTTAEVVFIVDCKTLHNCSLFVKKSL